MYEVILRPDDNGTILVICPDLPEVTTFGEDETDAVHRAADAIEEALAARITRREDVPMPSVSTSVETHYSFPNFKSGLVGLVIRPPPLGQDRRIVHLPPLTTAKVELYRVARAEGVSTAELARRLGWHGPQVDRLFDLNHRSTIEHIDQALRVIGKRLTVGVEDVA